MPIYQYKCQACGHQLEALQKMSDAKLVDCPACQQAALVKQVTAAAFKLKGTGWYETDFKNSGAQPVNNQPDASASSKANDVANDSASSKAATQTSSNASN